MFYVEEEYCGVLDLPIDLGILWFFQSDCLGESEECLRFAHHNGLEMGVWVIDDMDSSEWVLVHKISFADIEFPGPLADSDFVTKDRVDILAFHPNSDAIFLSYRGDFFCYDFNSKALENFMCYHPSATVDMLFQVYPFLECICSLANAQGRI
eukprot:TRINITY_DN13158_c1_g1_i1.p1 TRINITY_DN13158_c1_g1~~TRINITY_DN13158_c1_g1_i1.p1  ORF type:complete len:153 (+),score=21.75 TRINITY_DN13158_c1_g1_i1:174-632(+)